MSDYQKLLQVFKEINIFIYDYGYQIRLPHTEYETIFEFNKQGKFIKTYISY